MMVNCTINLPTPCLWQALTSAQKPKEENQAGHSFWSARWRVKHAHTAKLLVCRGTANEKTTGRAGTPGFAHPSTAEKEKFERAPIKAACWPRGTRDAQNRVLRRKTPFFSLKKGFALKKAKQKSFRAYARNTVNN